jgi:AraC-like DNA-binding protein
MDPLSELLDTFKVSMAVAMRFRFCAPYALSKAAVEGIPFRLGGRDRYWLKVGNIEWVHVAPGDLVLLPHGDAHVLASDPDVLPVDMAEVLAAEGQSEWTSRADAPPTGGEVRWGGTGEEISITAGILVSPTLGRNPLLAGLPSLIHVRADQVGLLPSLAAAYQVLLDEFMNAAPAAGFTVCRMAEIVLAQALRAHLESTAAIGPGWFRAMADPQIGRALLLMQQAITKPWTVDSLAREVGMSRTRFAARFLALIGTTPMDFLTRVRLTHAAERLVRGDRVGAVAEAAGYGSEKAFSRAFRRWAGIPPGRFRTAERGAR